MRERETVYIISAFLVASVIANIYLWNRSQGPRSSVPTQVVTSSDEVSIDSPYGFRSEVVAVYENGKAKTHATTTPITEEDLDQMRKQTEARLKEVDDYFREQENFFRSLWYSF